MTTKIDNRRNYILVIDTETANSYTDADGRLQLDDSLFYDLGYAVIDKWGTVYETGSYVNADIYLDCADLMKTAYYAKKLPRYEQDLQAGTRKLATTTTIKRRIAEVVKRYKIKQVCAHNAAFDIRAINNTQRFITKSKYRYFLPYGLEVWDSMKMAASVICNMPTYKKFCVENGYICKNGQPRKTAEILYRFISKDNSFIESHTGLEDVLIEKEIIRYCYQQKKSMKKVLYAKKCLTNQ